MNIHQNTVIFLKKTMKVYFKAVMLSLKIYENILKFIFLMGGGALDIGGILGVFRLFRQVFKLVIYGCKKRWRCRNFIDTLKYLWTDTNKHEWARCKTMKSRLYSRHASKSSEQNGVKTRNQLIGNRSISLSFQQITLIPTT